MESINAFLCFTMAEVIFDIEKISCQKFLQLALNIEKNMLEQWTFYKDFIYLVDSNEQFELPSFQNIVTSLSKKC